LRRNEAVIRKTKKRALVANLRKVRGQRASKMKLRLREKRSMGAAILGKGQGSGSEEMLISFFHF
jgi:hypothetical protein